MQLEHIEEMLQEDFQESITEIIAPEHIKIIAKKCNIENERKEKLHLLSMKFFN